MLFNSAWDEFEDDFCREPCNAAKRCGHKCQELCHADMDDSHTTGINFDADVRQIMAKETSSPQFSANLKLITNMLP